MDNKKDLTRIEDLGEFLHELGGEENFLPPETPMSEELPGLPSTESFLDESTSEEESLSNDFGITEESSTHSFEKVSTFDENTISFTTNNEAPSEAIFESTDFETQASESESTDFPSDFDANKQSEEKSDEILSSWDNNKSLVEDLQNYSEKETETDFYTPSSDFKTPENFEDLKKFSESSILNGMATEGNPSFSILIKNVRYIEDVNDIVTMLRELNLLTDPEEQVKSRLMRGMLLVPRISEYAGIFLCHKLRRFDIDILMGPSDEIHPPKHQETPETGIISKTSLLQNQSHQFQFDNPRLDLSQIIVAATQSLEGYQIIRYMGVASEHKMLDSSIVEDEGSTEIPHHYQELAGRLKAHALKNHSNAVVGLNYQLTPIPGEFGLGGHKYRLTCTGNLVWVNKL